MQAGVKLRASRGGAGSERVRSMGRYKKQKLSPKGCRACKFEHTCTVSTVLDDFRKASRSFEGQASNRQKMSSSENKSSEPFAIKSLPSSDLFLLLPLQGGGLQWWLSMMKS